MIIKNKKIAVLVSGNGTNLQAITDAITNKELENTEISIVISSNKDAYALNRASKAKVKSIFVNPKDFESSNTFDKKLVEIINQYNVDLVILAGYIRILTDTFINTFPNKIINIHPALLPKFGGAGMYGKYVHEAVIKSGDKESGCTAHFVTCEVDAGPIINQRKIPVLPNDTAETLSKRVLAEEHKLFVTTIKKILFEEPIAISK